MGRELEVRYQGDQGVEVRYQGEQGVPEMCEATQGQERPNQVTPYELTSAFLNFKPQDG